MTTPDTTPTAPAAQAGTAKPTKSGVVAALLCRGWSQQRGPFPAGLTGVLPTLHFTPAEMDFAKYLEADTDFGGAWNDAEQINLHLS